MSLFLVLHPPASRIDLPIPTTSNCSLSPIPLGKFRLSHLMAAKVFGKSNTTGTSFTHRSFQVSFLPPAMRRLVISLHTCTSSSSNAKSHV